MSAANYRALHEILTIQPGWIIRQEEQQHSNHY